MSPRILQPFEPKPWRGPALVAGLLVLLILLAPAALAVPALPQHAARVDHHPNTPATAPTAGLSWAFTGNTQIVVKATIAADTSTHINWGVLYRNDEKIKTFVGWYKDYYYLDEGLTLGQTYVYKLIAYTQDKETGKIETSDPLYTPAVVTGEVEGDIPVDMTWNGGTWNTAGPIEIIEGAVVTIKPGTTVVGGYGQFRLQSGKLFIEGATLKDLVLSFVQVTLELNNTLSVKNCILENTQIVSRAAKVFEGNWGTNCVIDLYDFAGPSVRYHNNMLPDSDFYIDYQADADGQTDVTLDYNDFGTLTVQDVVPVDRENKAKIFIHDNAIAGNLVVRAARAEQRYNGFVFIGDNRVSGIELEYVTHASVFENTIVCSPTPPGGGPGITLGNGVSDCTFGENRVRNCGTAIWMEGDDPSPHNNEFKRNLAPNAQVTLGYGYANTFYDNAFSHVLTQAGSYNNIWSRDKKKETNVVGGPYTGGNWYADYAGVDANGDGIGDSLHYIDARNIDYYPLVVANPGPDLGVDAFQFNTQNVYMDSSRRYILVTGSCSTPRPSPTSTSRTTPGCTWTGTSLPCWSRATARPISPSKSPPTRTTALAIPSARTTSARTCSRSTPNPGCSNSRPACP